MKLGAADYLPKPFDNDELRVVVRRVMETRAPAARPPPAARAGAGRVRLRAASSARAPAMRRVFETIDKVADTDVTVLIRGESGTGKELVANALHYRSPRRTKPLDQDELRGAQPRAGRERALRPRARRVHRRDRAARGQVRGRRRRHALPRRGRRHAARDAGEAPARDPGEGVRARRRQPADPGRRPPARRDQPGPRGRGRGRAASARTSTTACGSSSSRSRRSPSGARTSRCWSTTSSRTPPSASAARRSRSPARRCAPASRTSGRATCASSARRSSRRCCSRPGRRSTPADLFAERPTAPAAPAGRRRRPALTFREAKEQRRRSASSATSSLQRAAPARRQHHARRRKRSACTGRTSSRRCASSASRPKTPRVRPTPTEATTATARRRDPCAFLPDSANLVRGVLGRLDRRAASTATPAPSTRRRSRSASRSTRRSAQAAAGVLYMRSKLASELERHVARADARARASSTWRSSATTTRRRWRSIGRRDALDADVERLTSELDRAHDRGRGREEEPDRVPAARSRACATRRCACSRASRTRRRACGCSETLLGPLARRRHPARSSDVRDHINRLVAEAKLSPRRSATPSSRRRLGTIRDAEADAGARAQLDELKRARRSRLLPMVVEPAAAAARSA